MNKRDNSSENDCVKEIGTIERDDENDGDNAKIPNENSSEKHRVDVNGAIQKDDVNNSKIKNDRFINDSRVNVTRSDGGSTTKSRSLQRKDARSKMPEGLKHLQSQWRHREEVEEEGNYNQTDEEEEINSPGDEAPNMVNTETSSRVDESHDHILNVDDRINIKRAIREADFRKIDFLCFSSNSFVTSIPALLSATVLSVFRWHYLWIPALIALLLGILSLAIAVIVRRSPEKGSNLPGQVKAIFFVGSLSFFFSGVTCLWAIAEILTCLLRCTCNQGMAPHYNATYFEVSLDASSSSSSTSSHIETPALNDNPDHYDAQGERDPNIIPIYGYNVTKLEARQSYPIHAAHAFDYCTKQTLNRIKWPSYPKANDDANEKEALEADLES